MAADGRCSLREAVTAAHTNAATGGCTAGGVERDVIVLGDGHYLLSRAGAGENGNATGDLDLLDNGPVTLRGVGRARTVVSAEGVDRVIDSFTDLTIADLTITGGAAPDGADGPNPGQPGESGGGIRSTSRLELRDVTVRGNRAGSGGAGGGSMTIGEIGGASGRGGDGGGIAALGITTVDESVIEANRAGAGGDGGNLGTSFSCPVTLASLLLDANGMPGPGSEAIDSASTCPPADLAGTARPQGMQCDVGALEVPAAPPAVARTGLEFGSLTTGTATTRSVDVSNPGLPALPLVISVTGDPAFTLDGHTCGAALGGAEDCAVTVRFAPTTAGARTGTLQIGGETLALGGSGVAPPSAPAPVDPQNDPPQATARCVVPRLKGRTLIAAARSLQNANCRLGTVTRRGRGRKGRVRSFSPMAGTSLPAGTAVRLVLNRRPRAARHGARGRTG